MYSTATKTGSIDITVKRIGSPVPQTISVSLAKGDSNNAIANKVRNRLSAMGYACNVTSNVITISGVEEVTSNVEVEVEPIAVTVSEVLDPRGIGVVEFITSSETNQNIEITINGDIHTIPILGGLTNVSIAEEVRDYFLNHDSGDFKKTTSDSEGFVYIRGKIDVFTISVNTDIPDGKPYMISSVRVPTNIR